MILVSVVTNMFLLFLCIFPHIGIAKLSGIRPIHMISTETRPTRNSYVNQTTSFQHSSPFLTGSQSAYLALHSLFLTCLIASDVVGVKLFEIKLPFSIMQVSKIEHTCGMLTFPITFLIGDLLSEYFGTQVTRKTVYMGLWMSMLVFCVMNLAQELPHLKKPYNAEAFNMIFGSAKLMYVASVAAYLVGQLVDIWLFDILKKLTRGKYLWLRATGSTLVSQLIDSFAVSYIAFSAGKKLTGQTPATSSEVINIAITGYGLKFVVSALMTPILYFARYVFRNYLKIEPIPY